MSTPSNEGETIRFGEGAAPEVPAPAVAEGLPPAPALGGGGEPPPEGPPPDAGEGRPPGEPEEEPAEEPKKSAKKKKKKKQAKGKSGDKKKGPPIIVLILLIVAAVAVIAFAGVLIFMKVLGGGRTADPPPAEATESEPAESAQPSPDPEQSGGEPSAEPIPTPTPAAPRDMTLAQAVGYVESLAPSQLGLPGESMADYAVYPSERLVLVNGRSCMEIDVYSDKNPTGTNSIRGRYFVTRASPRQLFRLDLETGEVTELPLDGGTGTGRGETESTASEEGEGKENG